MDRVRPKTVFGVAAALPVVALLGLYLGSRDSMSLPYEDDSGQPAGQQASLTPGMARPVDAVPITEPVLPASSTQVAQDTTKAKASKDALPTSDEAAPAAQPVEAPASAPPEMDTPANTPPPPPRPADDPPF